MSLRFGQCHFTLRCLLFIMILSRQLTKGSSRHSALPSVQLTLTSCSDIVQAADRGQLTALGSVFSTVNHDCLLSILQDRFSVEATAAAWFRSYLSDRIQTFTAGDSQSSRVILQCGMHHGSVLGPFKFIAYMEEDQALFGRHQVSYHLFADDKQVYVRSHQVTK